MKPDSLVTYYPEMACKGTPSCRCGSASFDLSESIANQYFKSTSASFTFSAKEKDAETGFSYFGSRYYSSDLSIWLSVDPMSDKYPSLSPYVYCADNPIKLVDPNGEEIYVGEYIYNNGNLYNKDGNIFKPEKGSFEEKALNSLNALRDTKQGSELMSPFEGNTGKDIVVKDASNNPHTPGKVEVNDEVFSQEVFKSATIYWNPQGEQLFKSLEPNPTTDLGHEFSHAYDKATGAEYPTDNYDHCPRNEWQAVYRENMIRGEMGVPYRKGYRVFLYNKNDGTKKPYFTKMISSSGLPFLP
jgi:RHS repeat-associated protein